MSTYCVACGCAVPDGESRCAKCQALPSDERWGPDPQQASTPSRSSAYEEPPDPETGRNRLRNRLVTGALALLVVGVLAFVVAPNFIRSRSSGGYVLPCKRNLKNIGTASEMYATDNGGLYPSRLALLTPNYLKVIPTCSSVGSDTYSAGYRSSSKPDAYTVVCAGLNHASIHDSENYPQYTSTQGLLEK